MIRLAKTENGMVEGLPAADPRITSFKGIPFAAPPGGGKTVGERPSPQKTGDGVFADIYLRTDLHAEHTRCGTPMIYIRGNGMWILPSK